MIEFIMYRSFEKLRNQLTQLMKHFSTKKDEILRIQREYLKIIDK